METEAELFRLALDVLDDPLSIQSIVRDEHGQVADFRYVFANRAAEALFGQDVGGMVGHSVLEIVPHLRGSGLYAAMVSVAETEQSALYEIRWDHPVRGRVVYEVQVLPLDDSIVACARDMTRRSEALEQIAVAEAERAETAGRLAIATERERIANELHQTLVRELFEVVLQLHTAAELGDADTRARLAAVIDRVDDAINQTRAVVFAARANGEEPAHPADMAE